MPQELFESQHGVLTIRELYEWALANGCEDYVIRYYDEDCRWSVATGIHDTRADDGSGEFPGEVFLAGY